MKAIPHANLIPPYKGHLFGKAGQKWLDGLPLPTEERGILGRLMFELERVSEQLANLWFVFTSCRRATTEGDVPGSNDAATISRFSASLQLRRQRLTSIVSIIPLVDISHLHAPRHRTIIDDHHHRRKAAHRGGSLTVGTWPRNESPCSGMLAEMALVQYRRGQGPGGLPAQDYFRKTRDVMQAWAIIITDAAAATGMRPPEESDAMTKSERGRDRAVEGLTPRNFGLFSLPGVEESSERAICAASSFLSQHKLWKSGSTQSAIDLELQIKIKKAARLYCEDRHWEARLTGLEIRDTMKKISRTASGFLEQINELDPGAAAFLNNGLMERVGVNENVFSMAIFSGQLELLRDRSEKIATQKFSKGRRPNDAVRNACISAIDAWKFATGKKFVRNFTMGEELTNQSEFPLLPALFVQTILQAMDSEISFSEIRSCLVGMTSKVGNKKIGPNQSTFS